jgi:hypothetical protein
MAQPYNYRNFVLGAEEERVFEDFRRQPRVGAPAPDAEMLDARTEARVRLSDLWATSPVIIEFGSVT